MAIFEAITENMVTGLGMVTGLVTGLVTSKTLTNQDGYNGYNFPRVGVRVHVRPHTHRRTRDTCNHCNHCNYIDL